MGKGPQVTVEQLGNGKVTKKPTITIERNRGVDLAMYDSIRGRKFKVKVYELNEQGRRVANRDPKAEAYAAAALQNWPEDLRRILELEELARLQTERIEQGDKAIQFIQTIMPGMMHESCAFDDDPEADPSWHCCDWSSAVIGARNILKETELEQSHEPHHSRAYYWRQRIMRIVDAARKVAATKGEDRIQAIAELEKIIAEVNV